MTDQDINGLIEQYNGTLNPDAAATAIILAAGHGTRIKSQRSKMLHKIWGKTTVERVSKAARMGLQSANICLVVGIKADSVIQTIGTRENQVFVYQEKQQGTGHAVQVALEALPDFVKTQDIYVFPGDIGLLRCQTVEEFRDEFKQSASDMMVLTGMYSGDPAENYYGRIVRVPAVDIAGEPSEQAGKVIQIMESKDIHALNPDKPLQVSYSGSGYAFRQQELININEFNTGVFAFRGEPLSRHIEDLDANNVQGELYVTDLIKIFNDHGRNVGAAPASNNQDVLGFNNKSVLKKMNSIYQRDAYDKLKNLVKFRDPEDFFMNDELVEKLIQFDREGKTLDLRIGKGVNINGNIEFGTGIVLKDGVNISGNIRLGNNVVIHKGAELSTYQDQVLSIGNNTQIFQDNIVKGNTNIGEHCRIESGVNVTGSDKYPTKIGDKVMIKGTSYIFGSIIEEGTWVEHCILKTKKVHCHYNRNGNVAPVRYVIPQPEGLDDVEAIGDDREEYTWPPSN